MSGTPDRRPRSRQGILLAASERDLAQVVLWAALTKPWNKRRTHGISSISSGCHWTAMRNRRSTDSSASITPSSDVPVALSGGATSLSAWGGGLVGVVLVSSVR